MNKPFKHIRKFVNKKFVIAIVVVLIVVVLIVVARFAFNRDFFRGSVLTLTGSYDLQRDYCGKALDIHYCNCAFRGEDCGVIGLSDRDKDAAYRLVTAGFEKWVIEKKKEECAEKGGRWVKDVCKK